MGSVPPGADGAEPLVAVAALAGPAILTLLAALALAAISRRPPRKRVRRKSFEHGRRLAHDRRPLTTRDALAALARTPVGNVLDTRLGQWQAEVIVRRRAGQPCVQAAGYVAGVFECAWAHEVLVRHPACTGEREGTCHFVVERVSGSGAPAGEASTPGSAGERHRSPRARSGSG